MHKYLHGLQHCFQSLRLRHHNLQCKACAPQGVIPPVGRRQGNCLVLLPSRLHLAERLLLLPRRLPLADRLCGNAPEERIPSDTPQGCHQTVHCEHISVPRNEQVFHIWMLASSWLCYMSSTLSIDDGM